MDGDMGPTGGLINRRPWRKDAEPVIQTPVGLPCLERGRLVKKRESYVIPLNLLLLLAQSSSHALF